MKNYIRWGLFIFGLVLALYVIFAAICNAWLSGTPVNDPEYYQKNAQELFILSFVIIIGDVILFIILKRRQKNIPKTISGDSI